MMLNENEPTFETTYICGTLMLKSDEWSSPNEDLISRIENDTAFKVKLMCQLESDLESSDV